VVNAADGRPWIGGNPFPNPKTGVEIFASQPLSWAATMRRFYAFREYDMTSTAKSSSTTRAAGRDVDRGPGVDGSAPLPAGLRGQAALPERVLHAPAELQGHVVPERVAV